jgi:hypothetical protein
MLEIMHPVMVVLDWRLTLPERQLLVAVVVLE